MCISFFNAFAFAKSNDAALKNKVEYYQNDNSTNQVPYFDNRFRLDANLDEITMVFYRKSGSRPVILIRPDGSKIRVTEFDQDRVEWFDDSTFDMIKIKKPMPGPWQAVGEILPNSQILVVSEVKIAVEPLPEIAFSGETLKVEGKLFNGEEAIDTPYFKEVVNLDINFYSTNNSRYENFGADAIKVSSFRDDGRGLDEYPDDSIFTGELVLDFAPGEWQPIYLVKLPMAIRELKQKTILLQKTPVDINVIPSDDSDKPHQVTFSIDPTYVDVNSLVFQGKFTFPDRQIEAFSILEEQGVSRSTLITNTEPGMYRINVSAFGKTHSGREFRLVVPEYSFNVKTDEPIGISLGNGQKATEAPVVSQVDELIAKADEEKRVALIAQKEAQAEKELETIIIIVAGNGAIILMAIALFLILRRNKSKMTNIK
jgi:uncharacterized protein (TIGR03503 family)